MGTLPAIKPTSMAFEADPSLSYRYIFAFAPLPYSFDLTCRNGYHSLMLPFGANLPPHGESWSRMLFLQAPINRCAVTIIYHLGPF